MRRSSASASLVIAMPLRDYLAEAYARARRVAALVADARKEARP